MSTQRQIINFLLDLIDGLSVETGLAEFLSPTPAAVPVSDDADKAAILDFLETSEETTDYTFRSTDAVATGTGLPPERVRALISSIPGIRRNTARAESWTLTT